jgi:hypothetical protein
MFRIDKTNIDFIFGKTNAKSYKDKKKVQIINDLYFNNELSEKTKDKLKKTWW